MQEEEIYYTLALTRMMGFNFQTGLLLYRELGGGKAVYDHRMDIGDVDVLLSRWSSCRKVAAVRCV